MPTANSGRTKHGDRRIWRTDKLDEPSQFIHFTYTLSGFPAELATVVVTDATIWYVACAELPYVTFIGFISLPFTARVVNGEINLDSLTNRRLRVRLLIWYGTTAVDIFPILVLGLLGYSYISVILL